MWVVRPCCLLLAGLLLRQRAELQSAGGEVASSCCRVLWQSCAPLCEGRTAIQAQAARAGAHGSFLATLLQDALKLQGILIDQPQVQLSALLMLRAQPAELTQCCRLHSPLRAG